MLGLGCSSGGEDVEDLGSVSENLNTGTLLGSTPLVTGSTILGRAGSGSGGAQSTLLKIPVVKTPLPALTATTPTKPPEPVPPPLPRYTKSTNPVTGAVITIDWQTVTDTPTQTVLTMPELLCRILTILETAAVPENKAMVMLGASQASTDAYQSAGRAMRTSTCTGLPKPNVAAPFETWRLAWFKAVDEVARARNLSRAQAEVLLEDTISDTIKAFRQACNSLFLDGNDQLGIRAHMIADEVIAQALLASDAQFGLFASALQTGTCSNIHLASPTFGVNRPESKFLACWQQLASDLKQCGGNPLAEGGKGDPQKPEDSEPPPDEQEPSTACQPGSECGNKKQMEGYTYDQKTGNWYKDYHRKEVMLNGDTRHYVEHTVYDSNTKQTTQMWEQYIEIVPVYSDGSPTGENITFLEANGQRTFAPNGDILESTTVNAWLDSAIKDPFEFAAHRATEDPVATAKWLYENLIKRDSSKKDGACIGAAGPAGNVTVPIQGAPAPSGNTSLPPPDPDPGVIRAAEAAYDYCTCKADNAVWYQVNAAWAITPAGKYAVARMDPCGADGKLSPRECSANPWGPDDKPLPECKQWLQEAYGDDYPNALEQYCWNKYCPANQSAHLSGSTCGCQNDQPTLDVGLPGGGSLGCSAITCPPDSIAVPEGNLCHCRPLGGITGPGPACSAAAFGTPGCF